MAGTALTNEFNLQTATVMLGAPADLYDFAPSTHSIGLVKNFRITSEPSYVELTQGVKNTIVHSTMNANNIRASMEVYEYTAKNLAYALGLDGSGVTTATTNTTVGTAVPASPAQATVVVASATGITANKYVVIEVDTDDNFVVRKVVSVSSNTLTLDADLPAIAVGAKVRVVNRIEIGSKSDQPFLAAKIAGKTANGSKRVIYIPKMRITKGFDLGFVTDNYGNMPFEFTVYDLVSTDANYADFTNAPAAIYADN